jgi:preprotein translocase subunit SecD
MRRFLAYVVMMITMLCAVVFNTQAVLENKIDAMEYGTGTQLVYSLTSRVAEDYDTEKYKDYSNGGITPLDEIDIEKKVMARLDAAGVRNADVSIVKGEKSVSVDGTESLQGYELRISLSPLSETELSNVKEILAFTGSLAIGTEGDTAVYYQSNDEFFATDDDVAALTYNGTTPFPVLKVKDAEAYENLKKAAEEASENKASEARRYNADGDEEEAQPTKVYLWMNKTLEDTYDRAYGTHDTVIRESTKAKVLAEIDISNWNSDNLFLSLSTDTTGAAFTISTARAFVNMLNCEDYGFDISYLYENNVTATFGSSSLTITYIIFGVVLLIICALLIAFYGLAGVTASLTTLGSVLLSFLLFSLLGFEFSVAALGGLAIILGLSVLISVNYFERVKTELKRGRDIVKANSEGYHKSFLTSLDVSAVTLVASIFCFLIGTGAFKTFFGVIMVGSIFTFLITNFINKWMMYWLVKDNAESKLPFFSFKKTEMASVEEKASKVKFASTDKKAFTNKLRFIIPAVAALSLGIGLPVSYFASGSESFFNNYNDFASTYTLNITIKDDLQAYSKLSNATDFNDYIVAIGTSDQTIGSYKAYEASSKEAQGSLGSDAFVYYADSALVNVVEKKNDEGNTYFNIYYSVKVNKDLDEVKNADGMSVIETITDAIINDVVDVNNEAIAPGGDSHFDRDELKIGSYEVAATNVAHTSNYLILVSFLISAFTFVYMFIRFGLNISLTSLATGTVATGLYLALLAITRIPYSSYTVFAVVIAVLALNMFLVPALGRNRETLKERGLRKTATEEERAEIANSSAVKALTLIIPVLSILLVYSIGLAFVNVGLIGLSIASVLFLLLDIALIYFFAVPFYHFLATHISFERFHKWSEAKREKRNAKKKNKKAEIKRVAGPDGILYVDDGPHETIIPGMNDFINND